MRSRPEVYIRTYRQLIAKVQATVAKFVRDALQAKDTEGAFPDLFREVSVMNDLKTRLCKCDTASEPVGVRSEKQLPRAFADANTFLRYQLQYGSQQG